MPRPVFPFAANPVQVTGQDSIAGSPDHVHEPSANTAAVVTLAAPGSGSKNVIGALYWSYDDAPTGGSLAVTSGGDQIFKVDVTAAGPGFLPFPGGLGGGDNDEVIITLAAGGGSVSGIVNAHAWVE